MPEKNVMSGLLRKLPEIIKFSELLTEERLNSLHTISSIDIPELGKTINAAEKINKDRKMISMVENGLHDIRGVVSIQNQVKYVSDIRDQIGLVVGSLPQIKELADNVSHLRPILAMQPMIEEVLALSVKMDTVLDLEETMDHVNMKLELVQEKFDSIEKMNAQSKESAESAANMLNEIRIREKVIDEKLEKMERLQRGFENLTVDVTYIDSDLHGTSRYSVKDGMLRLGIPVGKQGDKGDSIRGERGIKGDIGLPGNAVAKGDKGDRGSNGRDFSASLYGLKNDLKRFGNRAKSTSLVALDESPTMIYFKRSDALDDWTDGQPFGISHGDLSINEIAGAVMLLINEKRNQHG